MNIGIIGCGYWGPNLVRNFNALDDVTVAAVSDVRKERLEYIGRQFPAVGVLTTDAGDILRSPNIDAVVIACLLYTSPSPRDRTRSRMPSSA